MKYILDNKSDSIKSINENEIEGLEIPSKKDNLIGAKNVVLIDKELKELYIRQTITKKITAIIGKLQFLLENGDSDEGTIAPVLDEIQKLKGIIINKYSEHLKIHEYWAFLEKITAIEEEFQRKYEIKQIYKEMMMENFDDNKSKGR